jgi:transcriptional regulator with XRE-family HTH domain
MYLPGLKRHRILAGLTQQELAERAGMSRRSISTLENTKHPARPRTLKKLAGALGVRTQDLAGPGDAAYKLQGAPMGKSKSRGS